MDNDSQEIHLHVLIYGRGDLHGQKDVSSGSTSSTVS